MMRFAPKSPAALALVLAPMLALAACGGGSEQAEEPAASDTPPATGTATPTEAATPTATPTPTGTASATPTPTPSAAATPATAAVAEPAAFAVCKACHSVEPGKNGIGPSLAGIFGDRAATVPGFEFSQPMKDSGLTWNQATLDRYLTDPRGVVPGTKMSFGGVADAAKRKAIIDYLRAN